jgi:hypothetical protein
MNGAMRPEAMERTVSAPKKAERDQPRSCVIGTTKRLKAQVPAPVMKAPEITAAPTKYQPWKTRPTRFCASRTLTSLST